MAKTLVVTAILSLSKKFKNQQQVMVYALSILDRYIFVCVHSKYLYLKELVSEIFVHSQTDI